MADTKKEKQFPIYVLRGSVAPNSINEEDRTVEVVFGTDAKLLRRSWRGKYYETLLFSSENVRMDRIASGRAPLLNNHDYWGGVNRAQIGVVTEAVIDGKKGRATVRLSKRDNVGRNLARHPRRYCMQYFCRV